MNPLFRKLRWLTQRRLKEAELREELEFHLAEEASEGQARGQSDEQARAAARRDLGNISLVVEDTRTVWGWPLLDQLSQDLRYGMRSLRRNPNVSLAAVITLALGIGLTTTVFSIVNGVLLRPLPFRAPDQLVVLHTIRQSGDRFDDALSPPNFMSLKSEESRVFENLAGIVATDRTLRALEKRAAWRAQASARGSSRRLTCGLSSAGLSIATRMNLATSAWWCLVTRCGSSSSAAIPV